MRLMHSAVSQPPGFPLANSDVARERTYREPRKRTCLNGKLAYGDGMLGSEGAFTLDCTIHDISDGGAKVVLTHLQSLPPVLYLIVVKYCIAYKAQVVWQRFPARGLRFLNTYKLGIDLPEEVSFLRRLWLELAARTGPGTIAS